MRDELRSGRAEFNHGLPLLFADRRQVGERLGNTVRLWSQEYRIHRQWLWPKLRFTVTDGERTVLRVHERFIRNGGARALDTHSAPALDPVVTLALILLEGRPHNMGLGRGTSGLRAASTAPRGVGTRLGAPSCEPPVVW